MADTLYAHNRASRYQQYPYTGHRQFGYTLIETLAAVAITGILTTSAVTSMHSLMSENRMTTQVNQLVSSLNLARSEAIKRNQRVGVCFSADGEQCGRSNSWHQGWITYIDEDRDNQRDSNEPLISYHQQEGQTTSVTLRRSGRNSNHYIYFKPSGMTGSVGTFTFCDAGASAKPRALIFYRTGRVRFSYKSASGRALSCNS